MLLLFPSLEKQRTAAIRRIGGISPVLRLWSLPERL
jgi:hypothetical protein